VSQKAQFGSLFRNSKNNSVIMLILIAALIIDTTLSNVSDMIAQQAASAWGIALFVAIIAAAFAAGQYFLSGYVKHVSAELRSKKTGLNTMFWIVTITQFVLMAILFAIILQLIFDSEYYTVLLVAATMIGYVLGGVIMGLLCYRLFSWYKENKRALQILLFAVGSAMTSGTLIGGIISQNVMLLETHVQVIGPQSKVAFPTINPDVAGIMGDVLSISYLLAIIAYFFIWSASAIMLSHYSHRIGKMKYWIIVSLPLGSFLFGLVPIILSLPVTSTYFDPSLLVFRILSISALVANGVLFGMAFLTIMRNIRNHVSNTLVDYLTISMYGIVLLYISLAANIAQGSYPPFGATSYSFIGAAAYFFMSGIYSSAISVSSDSKLRQLIKRAALDQSRLIDNISAASLKQELVKKMMHLLKSHSSNLVEETGIESSLDEDDIKYYIEEALRETHRK
jgi:hypothetical protein